MPLVRRLSIRWHETTSRSRTDLRYVLPWLLLTLKSETQLKRRFQLWGVRKYIPQQDMTAILSVKTQHDVAGKQVRIQYKDHDIDHERIERAFKRRKGPLNAPRCKVSEHTGRVELISQHSLSHSCIHPVLHSTSAKPPHTYS